MTTRLSVFDSPFLLGFEQFERTLDRVSKSAEGYPPYNIEQMGEDKYRITLAVAGFTMDDLAVSMEDNQLVIKGKQKDDSPTRIFLHRGIAARQFQRSFVLADGIEVTDASLDNGLLNIDLVQIKPKPKIKHIQISKPTKGNGKTIEVEAKHDNKSK